MISQHFEYRGPVRLGHPGLHLLEADGTDAVTIRGVARLTGVSHTAPLHHFPHREALLDAIAQRGFDRLLAALAASFPIGQ